MQHGNYIASEGKRIGGDESGPVPNSMRHPHWLRTPKIVATCCENSHMVFGAI